MLSACVDLPRLSFFICSNSVYNLYAITFTVSVDDAFHAFCLTDRSARNCQFAVAVLRGDVELQACSCSEVYVINDIIVRVVLPSFPLVNLCRLHIR